MKISSIKLALKFYPMPKETKKALISALDSLQDFLGFLSKKHGFSEKESMAFMEKELGYSMPIGSPSQQDIENLNTLPSKMFDFATKEGYTKVDELRLSMENLNTIQF